MRCPKSRFPIQIIVFDEVKIIIFVSQGLTLSTASLVFFVLVICICVDIGHGRPEPKLMKPTAKPASSACNGTGCPGYGGNHMVNS